MNCGAFNVESETLALLSASGMAKLVTARAIAGTRGSYCRKPGKFADYMCINRFDAVRRFEVLRAP